MGDLRQPATMFTELNLPSDDGDWLPVNVVIIVGQPDETREFFSDEFGIDPATDKVGLDGARFSFCSIVDKPELWELLFMEGFADGVTWLVIDGDDRHLGVLPSYRPSDAYHIPVWVSIPTIEEDPPEPKPSRDVWTFKYSGKVYPGQVMFRTGSGELGTTPVIGDHAGWPVGVVTAVDKDGLVTVTREGEIKFTVGKPVVVPDPLPGIEESIRRFKRKGDV